MYVVNGLQNGRNDGAILMKFLGKLQITPAGDPVKFGFP